MWLLIYVNLPYNAKFPLLIVVYTNINQSNNQSTYCYKVQIYIHLSGSLQEKWADSVYMPQVTKSFFGRCFMCWIKFSSVRNFTQVFDGIEWIWPQYSSFAMFFSFCEPYCWWLNPQFGPGRAVRVFLQYRMWCLKYS